MIFREPGAREVEERVRDTDHLVASRLLRMEAERALIRVRLDQRAIENVMPDIERELTGLWAKVNFFEITREICDLAGRIAPVSRLRTLDAIHLATFHRVRRLHRDVTMLSVDDRLLREL